MNGKITLYAEQDLIDKIKQFASSRQTSVSGLVKNYFKALLSEEKQNQKKSVITDSLFGTLKDVPLKEEEYREYLTKKYL